MDFDLEESAPTLDGMLEMIKSKILERGEYGIRGLGWTFRIMDQNSNGVISVEEFRTALMDYGINLTKDHSAEILWRFDKNKDGFVDFNEFLRFLRGDINAFRQSLILQAYKKLDVNRDGLVKLDDVA